MTFLNVNLEKQIKNLFGNTSRMAVWLFFAIFLVLILSIGIIGIVLYNRIENRIMERVSSELQAIADLKVEQIHGWRQERIADIRTLRDNPLIAEAIYEIILNPELISLKSDLESILRSYCKNYDYKSIHIFDLNGRPVASSELTPNGLLDEWEYIYRTTVDQEIRFIDFRRNESDSSIRLSLMSPVEINHKNLKKVIGTLIVYIDPNDFLYPYIQTWPDISNTAETLIVRKEGNSVLFLNTLRHEKNTALNLKIPTSVRDLPATMAVEGTTGIVEGEDYRNVAVLAALRNIPDSPWFLISKIDKNEIKGPIREQTLPIALMTGSLLLMCIIGIVLVNKWQVAQYYQKQYQMEIEKEALNQHFQYLTKHANDIILLFNEKFQIIEANEKALEIYRYSYDEMMNMNASDLRASPDSLKADDLGTATGKRFETIHKKKNGTIFPVEASSRYIEISGKKFIQSIIRDITDRKHAEQELKEERDLLDKIMNMNPVGIVVLNADGGIEFANSKAEDILGLEMEEIKNRTYADPEWEISGIDGKPLEVKNLPFAILKRNAKPISDVRHAIKKKTGKTVKLSVNGVPIFNEKNEFEKAVMTVEDITERIRIENEIISLNSSLERMVEEKTRDLQSTVKELESFAYTVSHDLRAPLRHMSGYINFLQEDYGQLLDETGKKYLQKVAHSSQTMGELIDALLEFSRLGRKDLNREKVDLNQVIEKAIETMEPETTGRNIEWRIDSLPFISADANLINQVFMNLISNAIKYSRDRDPSIIEVGLNGHSKSHHTIFVKDNGIGFDMKYANKLFGVFERLHVEDYDGIGIGLANVQKIVSRHGGTVWAEGKENKGAKFYIQLPKK